ncbi:MAG: hypothetical protein ACJ8CR_02110 [Roseiflexaceae bacterium]
MISRLVDDHIAHMERDTKQRRGPATSSGMMKHPTFANSIQRVGQPTDRCVLALAFCWPDPGRVASLEDAIGAVLHGVDEPESLVYSALY